MEAAESIVLYGYEHKLYKQQLLDEPEMLDRSAQFYKWIDTRRSVREFSTKKVAKAVIENIIKSAATAPSGAHKQPWTFCAVANAELKSLIRVEAEKEELETYTHRMSERWKKDLAPLATNHIKPFLEEAPWLLIAFKQVYEFDEAGDKHNNYYVNESIGIACGMLITAIHNAGLVTLTHTPSPMNFLTKVLNRPSNERAFLLLPVGYPKQPTYIPNLERKPLQEVSVFYE